MMEPADEYEKMELVTTSKMSIEQLLEVKKNLEREISNIQESLQTLFNCKFKYSSSKEALGAFQPDWQNRDILVPLTSSLYVPGRIKDLDNFVLDIGTGYYIEKNLQDSMDYFQRRADYVQEQIEKIESIQLKKTGFHNLIVNHIEMKKAILSKQMQPQQTA